jgi:cobalt-precorrin-5B (C1)-methyltransferase
MAATMVRRGAARNPHGLASRRARDYDPAMADKPPSDHDSMRSFGHGAPNGAPALRKGWTTGACAAAASRAAFEALMTGRFPDPVTIRLPRGECPSFALADHALETGSARAGVIKDAGDDPDVTHGALIQAIVAAAPEGSGIAFHAGPGVGTITLPGLQLAVGEPAINPGPRRMIREAIAEAAEALDVAADASVTIAVPGGEALAARTMNRRLGIVGGISILGTTGVVLPYSCSAWIHSIYRGIDVARAAGLTHIGAATGSTSEAALQKLHGLSETALIDMGDFAGGMVKYLRRHPVPRLSIGGGFAKLAKLAQGHLDLHSSRSSVDLAQLADLLLASGGSAGQVDAVRRAHSAAAALAAAPANLLGDAVARGAREMVLASLAGATEVDVAVFDRAGTLIGHAGA